MEDGRATSVSIVEMVVHHDAHEVLEEDIDFYSFRSVLASFLAC